jgi:hypothetical protein
MEPLPGSVVSRHFDEISGGRFQSPNRVVRVPRRNVVRHHDVLWHDVASVLDDVIEDGAATGAERVELDRHGGLVQLQKLRRVRHVWL